MSMQRDTTYESFIASQIEAGLALAGGSELLDLEPLSTPPYQRFVAEYRCKGLVRIGNGAVREADHFVVGIWMNTDYLRWAHVPEVLTWLGPLEIWHPNIRPPHICIGELDPGTLLVDLLYRCYAVICYQRCTMREDNALNWQACRWARGNQERFPIDRRPLKWRAAATRNGRAAREDGS